jgi:hypothetical protein
VVVGGMVVGGVYERFELVVGDGVLVDVEGRDGEREIVKAPGRVLAGVWDVVADIHAAFDFDPHGLPVISAPAAWSPG